MAAPLICNLVAGLVVPIPILPVSVMANILPTPSNEKSILSAPPSEDKINFELLEEVLPRVILWSPLPVI